MTMFRIAGYGVMLGLAGLAGCAAEAPKQEAAQVQKPAGSAKYAVIPKGKECFSCQTTPDNWFTAVHHRETPDRIRAGASDAGFVWKTETQEAVRLGAPIEGVVLPPEDSLRNEVAYAIGALTNSPRKMMAAKYLEFLPSPECQAAYAKFGFVNASTAELRLKPIPD